MTLTKIKPTERFVIVDKEKGVFYCWSRETCEYPGITHDPFLAETYKTLTEGLFDAIEKARQNFQEYSWEIRVAHISHIYGLGPEMEQIEKDALIRRRAISKLTPEECDALGIPLKDQLDDEVPFSE